MIKVELSAAEVPFDPGGTAQLTVTITNKQDHDDHVFLEIEGIDVEWYALPVPAVNVAAGETQSARVLFKIARSSECQAGTYPFLVRARGMESGESGIQQASLVIKPFSSLQVELSPRRAASTAFSRVCTFEVNVSNPGNREETLDLYASDPDDGCAYEFRTDRITVRPGHSESVALTVQPVSPPAFGSSRLSQFVVTARSVQDSYISANAHGQLDRRALMNPAVAVVLVLLLFGGLTWTLFRPKPVELSSFVAMPMEVQQGDEVTLKWDGANIAEAVIRPGVGPVKGDVGSATDTPEKTTAYEFVARGGGRQVSKTVTVIVTPRPAPPKPRVTEFTASRTRVHQSDAVTLSWKVEGAKELVLNPVGKTGEWPLYTSQEVRPETTTTFELGAKGPGGTVRKSVKVVVVPVTESLSEIQSFRAKPEKIYIGQSATLSWQVANAASVEIDNGVGGGLKPKDKIEVSPQTTTTYTLRVTDDRGIQRSKEATVVVEEAPPPDESPLPTDPPTTTNPPPGR